MAELTVPRVDFSSLGDLPDVYRNARTQATREMTLANLGRDGNVNYDAAAAALLRGGDLSGGLQLAQLGKALRPEQTNDVKNFLYAQGNPAFAQYQVGLKRAGATNNTNIVQAGENAFSKKAGEAQATRFNELAEGGPAAKQMISDINMLRELGSRIGTGKEAEIKAALGPYAQALGIDIKALPEIQAYDSIINRMAPSLRVKGSGSQSDTELRNFLKSLPSLGNTPEGNEIINSTMEGLQRNKIMAAEIASKALSGEISRGDAERQLRALPDPMQKWREFSKKNPAGSNSGWNDLGNGIRIREKR